MKIDTETEKAASPAKKAFQLSMIVAAESAAWGQALLQWKTALQDPSGRTMPKTLSGIYEGVGLHVTVMATVTALQVATSMYLEGEYGLSKSHSALAGGILSAFFVGPLELMLNTQKRLQVTQARKFSMTQTARYVFKAKSFRGFFIGTPGTAGREGAFTWSYLGLPTLCQERIHALRNGSPKQAPDTFSKLTGNLMAAGTGVLISNPFDAVKAAQQCAFQSQSFSQTAQHLFRTSGTRGFFRGVTPRVIRSFELITLLQEGPGLLEKANAPGFRR